MSHLSAVTAETKAAGRPRQKRLELAARGMELAARGLEDNEKYEKLQGYYERTIPARNILCYPLSEPESQVDFHEKLSILFEIAQQYRVSANYPSGMLMDHSPRDRSFFAYLEIYEQLDGHPFFRHFPEHTYRCMRREPKAIVKVTEDVPDYFKEHPFVTVIEADCITSPVCFRPYPVELQFY